MEVKPRYRGECESWTEATVDHIKASTENALSTGPFGSSIGSQFFENRGVPVIRGSNLANDGRTYLIDDGLIFVSEAKATEFRRSAVFQGDLIFTCWGTINQVGLVSDRAAYPRYIISNKQMKLTPDPKRADSAFLFYLFSGSDLQRQIKNQSIGSSVPGFNLGRLRALRFRVPALHEQKAIAEALSDADALIESLEQFLTKKRQIKKGAMQELLTGKKRLPGFSGEWEMKRLGELGGFLKGGGVSRDESVTGSLACVRYGELYTRHDDCIKRFYSWISREVAATATRLEQGDILFAGSGETKGEIGKCAAFVDDIEAYAGGDIVILRSKKADPLFLGYYLNTGPINKQKASKGQGDAVVHISAAALADIQCVVPCVSEQTAVASTLSDMDTEIAALESKLVKARQIKQGMMQELLTGRIRLV